jgi:hypothetical protein
MFIDIERLRLTVKANSIITEFQRASRLTGIFSRIAERLDVSPNHVRQVALGNRVSDRVMRELRAEMRKVDRGCRAERAA